MQFQAKPTRKQNAKLAIIPMLGLALAWMLFGPSDEDSKGAATPSTSASVQANITSTELQDPVERIARSWPEFDLDEVLAHDPFGGTPSLEQVNTGSEAGALADADPKEWPVSVYFKSKDGPIALANGHVLQRGDVVEQKWRVLALSNHSVVLEPLE